MGRHGLYYRTTLPGSSIPTPRSRPRGTFQPTPSRDTLAEIESGAVEGMTHSSSAALLEEIRRKRALLRLWPCVLLAAPPIWLGLAIVAPAWLSVPGLILVPLAIAWTARRDHLRKAVVLMYDFEPEAQAGYQAFHDGFEWLATARRTWHLEAQGATRDWKKQAGATSLVRRRLISPRPQDPPALTTNIAIPAIPVGRQTLYFLPDRLLVFEGSSVGAVGYEQLVVAVSETRFIEDEGVPEDAEVVGSTWKYVNKSGGPDRRFKDNRQLPIAFYAEVRFSSSTGLNEALQVSNRKAAEYLASGLQVLTASLAVTSDDTTREAQ